MAGRSQVDDSVIERRLRPIYDFLDNGNNKKAIQEADKALKKQPKLFCALVLKALACLRLGREDQCNSILAEVVSVGISDDATLQALTICYRELHKPELICKLYEHAVKLEPTNEDLMSHLFMSYVRIGDYKNQKATAMQLYKTKAKIPYYFWAVMSTIMQSHHFSDEKSKKISLQLAERMVDKIEQMNELGSEEEVLIYLYILELQEKYSSAVQFLDGPYCNKLKKKAHFILPKKGLYLTKLNQHEDANDIYKSLIEQQPDNWQHYVNFIDSLIKMKEIGCDGFSDGSNFLNKMKQACEDSQYRSPLLCHLQLALKLNESPHRDEINIYCGDPLDNLFNYISRYGDKRCCYSDIINFLQLIKPENVEDFLDRILNIVQFSEDKVPIDINNIYRHQTYLQLRTRLTVFKGSAEDYMKEGYQFASLYNTTIHFSTDMTPTDIRANDTYLIMAMHNFFFALDHLAKEKTPSKITSNLILYMCCSLQSAIYLSRANFQLKLLLIKLYIMIGASEAACAVYETLDLKHIQFDTLAYIMTFPALVNGCFLQANSILLPTLKFFMSNYKDTSDSLIMSYKYGSFTRIAEFIEFRDRLNNSLHFAICTAEQMLLEITMPSSPADLLEMLKQLKMDLLYDNTKFEELKDNRQFDVMYCWLPKEQCLKDSTIKESFMAEITMLKIRNLTLRIIGSASYSYEDKRNINGNKENGSVVNGDVLPFDQSLFIDLIAQLEHVARSCEKYQSASDVKFPLQGPEQPRLYLYLQQPYLKCFLKHCSIFVALQNAASSPSVGCSELKEAEQIVEDLISEHVRMLLSLQTTAITVVPYTNKDIIACLTHAIQTFCVVVVIMGCCCNTLLSFKPAKKNRKKKGTPSNAKNFVEFNKYLNDLHKMLLKLETALKVQLKWAEKECDDNSKTGYTHVHIEPAVNQSEVSFVCESIEKSYGHSLGQLLGALSSKTKYLSGLKV